MQEESGLLGNKIGVLLQSQGSGRLGNGVTPKFFTFV